MPKQKRLCAGTVLRVTEIQQVISASIARSSSSSLFSVEVGVMGHFVVPWLGNLFLYPFLPDPWCVFISKSPYIFLAEVWMYTGLRCLPSDFTRFCDLGLRIMRGRQISRIYLRSAEMLMH